MRPDAGEGEKRTNEIGTVIPLLETLPDIDVVVSLSRLEPAGEVPRRPGMQKPFRYFSSSPEVIRLAVIMSIRYPLSPRLAPGRGVRADQRGDGQLSVADS